MLWLARTYDAFFDFGNSFLANGLCDEEERFGVRLLTQDSHDLSSYSGFTVIDGHAVHQNGAEAGMFGDPIHHLVVIFRRNIDHDFHGPDSYHLRMRFQAGF